ncbi:MAG: DNA-binding protein WhiA [Synergistaceae bacterium]|nr:DNA-binding protein WhiA [Synergistaceae bacterium]
MDKDLWLAGLWDEWLTDSIKSTHAADSEASGLLMGMRRRNNIFTTNRLRAARRLTGPGKFRLWPMTSYAKKFNLQISMITSKNHKPSVKFTCPNEILKPPGKKFYWSWLKGLWGSTGGLYFPKNGYYLTLIISDEKISELAAKILESTNLSWNNHRNEFTLRRHDDIMTFLYNAGMPSGALQFEDIAIIRSARSRANIARNYDAANIARSVNAAREQIKLAEKILSLGMLDKLPGKLRELVKARLDYPDATLEELGAKLETHITKSAVKYRWSRIQKFFSQ